MGRLLRLRGVTYGGVMLALMFVASSCSDEQGGSNSEDARPEVREVTRTVTVAEAPKEAKPAVSKPKREAPAPPKSAPVVNAPPESAPAYVTVADGALSVEVPSSWGEVATGEGSEGAGASWSDFAGESVEYSLTAAPSLDTWSSVPGTPGVYAVASVGLAQGYDNEELVAAGPHDLSGACEAGPQRAFEREPYSGLVQEWASCGEAGGGYLTLAATPRGEKCVVLLQVGTAGQEGEAAGQHALDTLGADCGAAASYPLASADEQYAPEQYTEDSEPDPTPQYTPEDVPLTDQDISDEYNLEEQCAALGKVRAGRGCVFPEDASNVPLTDAEEGADETEVPEPPPLDPYDDSWTCDDIGVGPYAVPPGSPHDRDGDGLACEP